MATNRKISSIVENQFPSFARDEGPKFVAFIKAYYEWLEQANNTVEVLDNLQTYQDIDTTYGEYLEFFHREILPSIPRNTLVDRKLLAKHIKDLYRSRGSELSYKMLFRILYDEEIDFYYPGEDILRASDGRWVKENAIRLGAPRSGLISNFENSSIIGLTSGATARVVNIINTISAGEIVDELYLLDIVGVFQDNERVALSDDPSIYATIVSTSGPLQAVDVTRGGAFHRADDIVSFISASGSGANGAVLATSDQSAVEWIILDGGSGYTVNSTISITHNTGSNTSFSITSISNTEVIAINDDTITPFANVIINTGSTFVSLGANTTSVSANLASSNVSSALNSALNFSNTTVGTIATITTDDFGFGYSTLPSATVIEEDIGELFISDGSGGFKGRNANIVANNVSGAITAVSVSNFGADYNRYDPVTISNLTRSGTRDALGNPNISGIVNYPGRYIDTKGWLSWNTKLQDNFYYQEYSYEIRSDQFTNTYRELVKSILHPAGTKLFGRIRLYANVEPTIITVNSQPTTRLNVISETSIDLPTVISDFGSIDLEPIIEEESILIQETTTLETNISLLSSGTGELFINNANTINSYASEFITTYAALPISSLGSSRLLIGNNTIFGTEVPSSNTGLMIIDSINGTANGLYFSAQTYSNTLMTINRDYAGTTLSHGIFYYTANTSA